MYRILDLAMPGCCAANLVRTAVSLDHEQVSSLQPMSLQLTGEKLDPVDFIELEGAASDVRHSQERIVVFDGRALSLLLDSPAHLGNIFDQGDFRSYLTPFQISDSYRVRHRRPEAACKPCTTVERGLCGVEA